MEQYTNPNHTEYNGCISTTTPSQYFSKSFLDDPIFGLIPEGFDVCYNLFECERHLHLPDPCEKCQLLLPSYQTAESFPNPPGQEHHKPLLCPPILHHQLTLQ